MSEYAFYSIENAKKLGKLLYYYNAIKANNSVEAAIDMLDDCKMICDKFARGAYSQKETFEEFKKTIELYAKSRQMLLNNKEFQRIQHEVMYEFTRIDAGRVRNG